MFFSTMFQLCRFFSFFCSSVCSLFSISLPSCSSANSSSLLYITFTEVLPIVISIFFIFPLEMSFINCVYATSLSSDSDFCLLILYPAIIITAIKRTIFIIISILFFFLLLFFFLSFSCSFSACPSGRSRGTACSALRRRAGRGRGRRWR